MKFLRLSSLVLFILAINFTAYAKKERKPSSNNTYSTEKKLEAGQLGFQCFSPQKTQRGAARMFNMTMLRTKNEILIRDVPALPNGKEEGGSIHRSKNYKIIQYTMHKDEKTRWYYICALFEGM